MLHCCTLRLYSSSRYAGRLGACNRCRRVPGHKSFGIGRYMDHILFECQWAKMALRPEQRKMVRMNRQPDQEVDIRLWRYVECLTRPMNLRNGSTTGMRLKTRIESRKGHGCTPFLDRERASGSMSAVIIWRHFGNQERKLVCHVDSDELLLRHIRLTVRKREDDVHDFLVPLRDDGTTSIPGMEEFAASALEYVS